MIDAMTKLDETVTIGGDLTVGNIGYGAMQFTGPKVWGEYPDHDNGVALLREVVRRGRDFHRHGRRLRPSLQRPHYLRHAAIMSARRLGLDHIDLYYLHTPTMTDAPFEESVDTLARLRQDGLIRHIGLSNVSADQLRTALADHRHRRRHRPLQRRRPPRRRRAAGRP